MYIVRVFSLVCACAVFSAPMIVRADDVEVKVAPADLPKAVTDAIATAQPGGKIVEADKETKNGVDIYEVDVTNNGKKYEVKVDGTGKVLSNKEDDEKDEKDEKDGKK